MVPARSGASTPVPDRGVHTAPFYVLIGANMPSVLAEIAFVIEPGGREAPQDPGVPREHRQEPASRASATTSSPSTAPSPGD